MKRTVDISSVQCYQPSTRVAVFLSVPNLQHSTYPAAGPPTYLVPFHVSKN